MGHPWRDESSVSLHKWYRQGHQANLNGGDENSEIENHEVCGPLRHSNEKTRRESLVGFDGGPCVVAIVESDTIGAISVRRRCGTIRRAEARRWPTREP